MLTILCVCNYLNVIIRWTDWSWLIYFNVRLSESWKEPEEPSCPAQDCGFSQQDGGLRHTHLYRVPQRTGCYQSGALHPLVHAHGGVGLDLWTYPTLWLIWSWLLFSQRWSRDHHYSIVFLLKHEKAFFLRAFSLSSHQRNRAGFIVILTFLWISNPS